MVSPLFEKFTIVIGGLLILAGLYFLIAHFPVSGTAFVIAAIVGTAVVGGLVTYFTRNPA